MAKLGATALAVAGLVLLLERRHLLAVAGQRLADHLQLVIDGIEAKTIREILEIELEQFEDVNNLSGKVYESLGGFAPTIGILGAVLGLIHVMENLADPSKLGAGIAVAFVATIYGVGSANLLFLPMGGKIKLKTRELVLARQLIIEGLVSLAQAENPKMIEEKLSGYLSESQRQKPK